MAKKPSAADKLLAIPVKKSGAKGWFAKLDDGKAKAELEEIRTRWRAGAYQHSKLEIHEFCRNEFKLDIGYQVFVKWLCEKPNG